MTKSEAAYDAVAKMIQRAMKAKNLSNYQLSRIAGIRPSELSMILDCNLSPHSAQFEKTLVAVGIPLGYADDLCRLYDNEKSTIVGLKIV